MSKDEKRILEKLKKVLPTMSEREKGYLEGKADTLAERAKEVKEDADKERISV